MVNTPGSNPGKAADENKEKSNPVQETIYLARPAWKSRLGVILVLLGIGLLLIPSALYLQGVHSQRQLERQWAKALSEQEKVSAREKVRVPYEKPVKAVPTKVVPPSHRIDRGMPSTRISIPKISLQAVVVEGVTSSALRKGPGHFPGTADPGETGNCCIAGHRNMYGSWFRRLNRLSPGDDVVLSTPEAVFVYEVRNTFKVLPKETHVLDPTPDATLTLITCTPVPRPTHRLIVTAELVETRERHVETSSTIL